MKQRALSDLGCGKLWDLLGRWCRAQWYCGRQPIQDAVAANERQHLEESRAYRFSRDRHTNGVDQRSRLHISRAGYRPHGRFRRDGIEGWQRRQRRCKSLQMGRHAGAAEVLVHRGLVVLQGVRGSSIDPSANDGITAKLGIDATRPWGGKPEMFDKAIL